MTVGEFIYKIGFKTDQGSKGKAESEMEGLASKAKKLLGAIGLGFSIKGAFEAIKACVEVSSEVEEMQNKFDVVFRGMTDDVEEWAQSYADAIGRNSNTIKGYLADSQNLFVGMGMQREAGAKLSEQMVTLALDLASFNNLQETDAVNAMTKALMGESESAKTLGAVLNDNTRAMAMQTLGLTGTYQALDEATKMQVNYQAILNQSADAVGDCERSMGSYQSTLKQTQSKLEEIKTLVGQFFMPTFQRVLSYGNQGLMKLRDLITRITEFADSIGGTERLLALLAGTGAAVAVALNFKKIVTGAESLLKMLGKINLKTMAIIAVVVLLALIVDDFINFMQGNDSVIGAMLEKAGIDVDETREKIINTWNTIKSVLQGIWNFIKNVATSVWNGLKSFWSENGDAITSNLIQIWQAVSSALSTIWGAIKSIAESVFNALKSFWASWGDEITAAFSIVWSGIQSLFMTALNIITSLWTAFAALLSGDWSTFWESIKSVLQGIWDAIVTIVTTVLNALWALFGEKITAIKDTIINGFNAAIAWLQSLPAQAVTWGADLIQGLINGIKSKLAAVGEAVKGVANKITSFLHFSVPDEGPLTKYQQWMPDFMQGLANGINSNKDLVLGAISKLAGDIDLNFNGKGGSDRKPRPTGVSPRTAAAAVSNSSAKTINQTNNFNNHFNGGERETQKNLSKAAKNNAKDTSAELARALKFA